MTHSALMRAGCSRAGSEMVKVRCWKKGIGTSDDSKFSWEAERLTDFGDEARRPNST